MAERSLKSDPTQRRQSTRRPKFHVTTPRDASKRLTTGGTSTLISAGMVSPVKSVPNENSYESTESQDTTFNIEEVSENVKSAEHNSSSSVSSAAKLENERGQWPNQFEFQLSLIGYNIGFANFWRFPSLAYKYSGGTFLIPYTLALVFLGVPLVYLELLLGQYLSLAPVKIFGNIAPLFQGIGWAMTGVVFIVASYYQTLMAWSLIYLVYSFRSTALPWSTCKNDWNNHSRCYSLKENANCSKILSGEAFYFQGTCHSDNETNLYLSYREALSNGGLESASRQFFEHNVYDLAEDGEGAQLQWRITLALLVSWLLCFVCGSRGFRSFGLTIYFTALFPFIVLFILLISGVTLTGAADGIKFYLKPNLTELGNVGMWQQAAVQLLYSSGPSFGVLATMASFTPFRQKMFKHALIVSLVDAGTSFIAGFVVFSTLGNLAHRLQRNVSQVVPSGKELAFIVYPEAIGELPIPQVFSILFFFMLFTIGIDTQFVHADALVTAICDQVPRFQRRRWLVTASVCAILFVVGLLFCTKHGFYALTIFDDNASVFSTLYVCFLEIVCVFLVYGPARLLENIKQMAGEQGRLTRFIRRYYLRSMWLCVTPIALFVFLIIGHIKYETSKYHEKAFSAALGVLGATISYVPLILILIFGLKNLLRQIKHRQPLLALLQTTKQWAPAYVRAMNKNEAQGDSEKPSAPLDLSSSTGNLQRKN